MIHITCPNNNVPERTYTIEVLLIDVLGCERNDFDIQFKNDVNNYELMVGESKYIFEDHFFNHYLEPLSYLKQENLPKELKFFHGLGLELPIIYGEDKYIQNENSVIIGLDIFASTFFMLTRWEESLLGREEKGDCDETQLFCVKQGIHQRAIVNEYAVFLKKLLPADFSLSTRNYSVVLSHDVDGFLPRTWSQIVNDLVKQTIRGVLKHKAYNMSWKDSIIYKRHFPNAYSQFEMYATVCEKFNIPEWFYFKVCGERENEATYLYNDKQTVEIISKLKAKHNPKLILGFHPSQNVFGKNEQWNKEVSRITGLLQEIPTIGRNHHLLYNYATLRLWECIMEQSMNISNCVFHKKQGFRSGVCVPYHLFDLYQRRLMNLIEHPCQLMDMGIRYGAKNHSDSEMWNEIKEIINLVKAYRGELVLTWHIYVRKEKVIKDYFNWCEKVVQYATAIK